MLLPFAYVRANHVPLSAPRYILVTSFHSRNHNFTPTRYAEACMINNLISKCKVETLSIIFILNDYVRVHILI